MKHRTTSGHWRVLGSTLAMTLLTFLAAPGAHAKGDGRRGSYVITHPLENPGNPREKASKGRDMGRPARPEPHVREPFAALARVPDPEPHLRALAGGTSRRHGKFFYEDPAKVSLRPRAELNAIKISIPSPEVRRRPSTSKEALKGSH